MNNNPGITILVAITFDTDLNLVRSSYNVVDVEDTGVGAATLTLAVDCDIDSDIISVCSLENDKTCGARLTGAREIQTLMQTPIDGNAADGELCLVVYRVNPGLGEATYTP